MYRRIYQSEHPDGGRHVSNTSPHGQHRSSMMEGLQVGAFLAFDKDNGRIHDFVEFRDIEDPAIVGQSFIPQPAYIGTVRDQSI